MKTLPEILTDYFREVVDKAIEKHGETIVEFAERSKTIRETYTEAIAKELMGIIGEDEVRPPSGPQRNGIEQGLRRTRNRLRAEQRARLTAFIGEVEK